MANICCTIILYLTLSESEMVGDVRCLSFIYSKT